MRVVLLHAFPLDETMWAPQREALAGRDVVTPRLYGRGGSIDEWAASVLDELGGDDPLLPIGASMGGYVAFALARQAPERVAGLVLVGARAGADSPERREIRNRMVELLRAEGVEGYAAAAPFPMPPGLTADDLVGALEVLRDRPDSTDTLRAFRGPVLVVVGTDDELLSEDEARDVAALAPDGRAEVVQDAGHIVSRDRPEAFNALVRGFLDRWT